MVLVIVPAVKDRMLDMVDVIAELIFNYLIH